MIQKNNDNYYKAFFLVHLVLNLFCLDPWCDFMNTKWAIFFTLLTFVPIFLLGILSINNKRDLLKIYIVATIALYLPLLSIIISSWEYSIFSDSVSCCILFSTLSIVVGYLIVKIIKKEKVLPEEIEKSDIDGIDKKEKTKSTKESLSWFSKIIVATYYLILAYLILVILFGNFNDENGYRNDSFGIDGVGGHYYSCSDSSNNCFLEKCA
ncbi:MAG: hypothetical protein IKJ32_01420 [Clostridia bacterium]|nr:hypothetical protein [Clostridia bacterium]